MIESSSQRSDSRTNKAEGPLAIVCGSGTFPIAVAESVRNSGREVMLFPIRGFADSRIESFPHRWVYLGAFGRLIRNIHKAGCREVVLVGGLVRPRLIQLRFDLKTLWLLPRLVQLYRGGDNRLLSGIAAAFEEHGVRVRGAHEVAPDLLMPEGTVGSIRPSNQDEDDIRVGFDLIKAMGPFDVGQAVAIAGRRVIAIEAAEGTSGMLARIAEMRRSGRLKLSDRTGVLVKAVKPGQDRRIDLPAIGPDTVAEAKAAGLAGIAVEAKGAIVSDAAALTHAADKAGLFVVGALPAGKPIG